MKLLLLFLALGNTSTKSVDFSLQLPPTEQLSIERHWLSSEVVAYVGEHASQHSEYPLIEQVEILAEATDHVEFSTRNGLVATRSNATNNLTAIAQRN